MITCPECGQAAPDDAKFCDRCGQGLAKSAAPRVESAIAALEPGTMVRGEFRIVEVIGRSAAENRYRAERARDGSGPEHVQLRERPAPGAAAPAHDEARAPERDPAPPEDPTGPHAKTAELKRPAPAPAASREARDARATLESAPAPAAHAGAEGAARAGEESAALASRAGMTEPLSIDEAAAVETVPGAAAGAAAAPSAAPSAPEANGRDPSAPAGGTSDEAAENAAQADLGDLFGRVLALSLTVDHPAFARAREGFAEDGRVYLVYADEPLTLLAERRGGLKMSEAEAVGVAIQICQAVSFLNRRGLRLNDICPQSVAFGRDGRVRLLGLDYVSNDNELQGDPIPNDGYTAPEIYRGKRVDKRADVFAIGALLYSCLTGERLESESWREEAGPVRFYPPHVVTPELEQAVRRALLFDPAARWPSVDAFKNELVKVNSNLHIRAAAMTDVGMVREHNEDAVLAVECVRQSLVDPAARYLYVVADGMGGAEAGEVASAIAVEAIRDYVERGPGATSAQTTATQLLVAALEEANRRIIEYQAAHPESRGMGSTAVSVLAVPPEAAVAWVGDSRAYLSDAAGLRQLTRDHSLVQRLIEIGQITPEEARHHEHKNVITRSLGARQSGPAGAEGLAIRLKRGDRLLLCSDGLTAHVDDRTIGEVLRRHDDPRAATRELVVAANAGGGTDNVSVIVVFAD